MLSHATAQEWLIPYADGMLSNDERQRIDSHVGGCAACRRELGAVRQLTLMLVSLPPAPPLAFAPFWLKLQAALPAPRVPRKEQGFTLYRRAGLALVAAALASLAAASCAFAAESALPDNPLYPLKHLEESVRLSLTPAAQRGPVQLSIGSERLREAQVMASTGKPALAVKSVRAFRILLPTIAAAINDATDARVARDEVRALDVELTGVQEANATRGDDDSELKQLVMTSKDELDNDTAAAQLQVVPAL
ncbi:MAG TPA: DUF5667 domain-containing protein, partial [Candidatus Dormibacteraeota bacterium]|nr:DUF5667 domain-containing protein [Candidatus Dormibacteraeota bacterium]